MKLKAGMKVRCKENIGWIATGGPENPVKAGTVGMVQPVPEHKTNFQIVFPRRKVTRKGFYCGVPKGEVPAYLEVVP